MLPVFLYQGVRVAYGGGTPQCKPSIGQVVTAPGPYATDSRGPLRHRPRARPCAPTSVFPGPIPTLFHIPPPPQVPHATKSLPQLFYWRVCLVDQSPVQTPLSTDWQLFLRCFCARIFGAGQCTPKLCFVDGWQRKRQGWGLHAGV